MALQEAWLRGLEWDEDFPDDLKLTTHQWAKQLPEAPRSQFHVAIDSMRKQWKTSRFIHLLMCYS